MKRHKEGAPFNHSTHEVVQSREACRVPTSTTAGEVVCMQHVPVPSCSKAHAMHLHQAQETLRVGLYSSTSPHDLQRTYLEHSV